MTAGMEIIDRERERETLRQMDAILIFVCNTYFCVLVELIGCPGRVIRHFIAPIPGRTPPSSRTGPHEYRAGRPDAPNADDA